MNKSHNFYEILRVNSAAEDYVIQAAYRVLANKFHPDKNLDNPEAANRSMQAINEAYSILSVPDKRKAYDLKLQNSNKYSGNDNPTTASSARNIGREVGRQIVKGVLDEVFKKNGP